MTGNFSIPDDLLRLIQRARYISFDIFDTAIVRIVQMPADLFSLMDKYYKNINCKSLPSDFKTIRTDAEKKARELAWLNSGAVEITLEDIYECLTNYYNIDIQTAGLLKQFEIELETKACKKNDFIYFLYQYCLSNGKGVVFVSDMYLPIACVKRILEDNGYSQYRNIYLSSVHKTTKSNGGLYKQLIKDLSCRPHEILHIGDNYDSDIKMAQRNGLLTYYYEKCRDRAYKRGFYKSKGVSFNSDFEESVYNALIINKLYAFPDNKQVNDDLFWYRFGYRYAGLLFYAFTTWIIEQAINDKIEKLFFLSRDGYIVKRVYDILSGLFKNAPPSEYMYASRRALNIPGIVEMDEKTLDFLVSGTSTLSVEQFLKRIGLDPIKYMSKIKNAGFSGKDDKIITGKDYGRLRRLFVLLAEDIKRIAEVERDVLFSYLNDLGIFNLKNIGLVDIGWHGTLQQSIKNIFRLYGKDVNITGYYLGTWQKAEEIYKEGHNMRAYLCEFGRPEEYHNILKRCVEIFEFLFTGPHGSVIKFEKTSGKVIPILEKNDFELSKIKKAEVLQKGALDFIKEFMKVINHFGFLDIPKDLVIKPIKTVLENPTYEEALQLGDLEHAEGFGNVYVRRFIANPPRFSEVFFNPFKYISGYKQAFWRIGYRKRFFSWKHHFSKL
jgi:HAD superfamily hydrolase (TIGR01549 family)